MSDRAGEGADEIEDRGPGVAPPNWGPNAVAPVPGPGAAS